MSAEFTSGELPNDELKKLNTQIQDEEENMSSYLKEIHAFALRKEFAKAKISLDELARFLSECKETQDRNVLNIKVEILSDVNKYADLLSEAIKNHDFETVKLLFKLGFDPGNSLNTVSLSEFVKLAKSTRDEIRYFYSDRNYYRKITELDKIITLLDLYKYKMKCNNRSEDYFLLGRFFNQHLARHLTKLENCNTSDKLFKLVILFILYTKQKFPYFSKAQKEAAVSHFLDYYVMESPKIFNEQHKAALNQGRLGTKMSHFIHAHNKDESLHLIKSR